MRVFFMIVAFALARRFPSPIRRSF
jgi:hypothetical protein